VFVGRNDLHLCPEHVATSVCTNQAQSKPPVTVTDCVQKQSDGSIIIGNENIGVAIIVDVAECGASANLK
jgi:hypothetical protein